MVISIQGKKGSYSYLATNHLFNNQDITFLERDSFAEVFTDLSKSDTDFAVIPIENSTYGSIYKNFDLLTKNNFFILQELYLKINLNLIVNPNSKFQDITEVYVHPVAREQVASFFEEHSYLKIIEHPDTAGSVEHIKNNNLISSAAIASSFAAELNNMEILQSNIQENKKNFTRFFVLSKAANYNTDSNKFTIEFSLGEESGSLIKVLDLFAKNNIALTKIESRPIINTNWEYRFYVDGIAQINSKDLDSVLKSLSASLKSFRILGFYKKGEYINT